MKFDTIVIYDEDGPIDVIHGQNSELLRTLQKHSAWETIMEELDLEQMFNGINDINDLVSVYTNTYFETTSSIKIKLFPNQKYLKP